MNQSQILFLATETAIKSVVRESKDNKQLIKMLIHFCKVRNNLNIYNLFPESTIISVKDCLGNVAM